MLAAHPGKADGVVSLLCEEACCASSRGFHGEPGFAAIHWEFPERFRGPTSRTTVEAFKDRNTLLRDYSDFVLANLTAGPVEQFQILIQSHRQSALVAGSPRESSILGDPRHS